MPSPCWGRPPKRCPSRSPAKNHGWPHLVRWFSHPWETSHGHSSHCVLKLFGSFLFAVAYNCLQWRPRTVGFGVADEYLHNPLVKEGMGRPKYATEDMWETLKHHSNQMFHNPGYQHIVCHCHTCWLHLFPLPPLPPSPSWQQHRHHEHLTSIIAGSCSSSWSWSWSCTSSWCSSSSWSSSYSLPFARFQHMGVAMHWTFLVFSCKKPCAADCGRLCSCKNDHKQNGSKMLMLMLILTITSRKNMRIHTGKDCTASEKTKQMSSPLSSSSSSAWSCFHHIPIHHQAHRHDASHRHNQ